MKHLKETDDEFLLVFAQFTHFLKFPLEIVFRNYLYRYLYENVQRTIK